MNKNEILKEIQVRSGNPFLQFPSDVEMEEVNNVVSISLSAKCVIKNMQDDAAAFEGWILGLKAFVPDWSFCLCWEDPAGPKHFTGLQKKHYQRFLYRVTKFDRLFNWFSVGEEYLLGALRIELNKKYYLNSPSTPPKKRTNDNQDFPENRLENELVKAQPESLLELFNIPKGNLYRQLPMGVFEDKVSSETAIFPGGKSAADLWATSKDGALVLFELKAEGNNQVGAISELFFYSMVLADEQRGIFSREGEEGGIICSTTSLKAMLLAPNKHPLIREKVFSLLNDNKEEIEFGYVHIDPSSPFPCKRIC